ncbi:MAG TPA: nucleoside triphosphate pyrophosphohydrolase [Caulobacteraceae bacterium]|nr:nucleoside triphosphate pyrophosphohydrolase [Caulobacteraceae bacterium]
MPKVLRFRVQKLIRDGLPAIMRAQGLAVFDRVLAPDEHRAALAAKLVEEARELAEAEGPQHVLEELADVAEVMAALIDAHGLTPQAVEAARIAKRAERGGFEGATWNAAVAAEEGAPALAYYLARPAQYPPEEAEA